MIRRWLLLSLIVSSCAQIQENKGAESARYYYDMGMSSLISRNYSEAIANLFRASRENPYDPKIWNALGIAYMEAGEYEKAESAFVKALSVDKNFTDATLQLGILHFRKGEYDKAKEYLLKAISDEGFPQKHMAFYYLARVEKAVGNERGYLENLRKAVAYYPLFLEAQMELAQAYESRGEYDAALDVYRTLQSNGVNSPSVRLGMARVYYAMGDTEKAKGLLRELLEDRQIDAPTRSAAMDLLTKVLVKEQELKLGMRKPPPLEKPQPSTPPVKEQEHKPVKRWRIQLGAFSSKEKANSWKEKLERELGLKDITVEEQGGVYRIFYGSFEDRKDAERELRKLRDLNVYGFIVD
ncbi:Sporulation domain protein [Thermocrinis albus DSM 14484]|uniref:Sporulation domain protein n=1 Tax=Thermocrinis albus (strain DSM 14484 / JCM 11386 / HI 11/12) TaxID=638303 RepID=D3SP50_THEAH|nr:SPOR domain-containing protein [Thermocrinis albus]ADC88937.1 Sporulation domain protein [Thermocrinis albus DSM 14484]